LAKVLAHLALIIHPQIRTFKGNSVAPRERNALKTKAKILKIATLEFSSKLFDGARMDRIAARANINKYMLYHYFGGKDGLFTAVLEAMYGSIRESQKDIDAHLSPSAAMKALIAQTYEVVYKHPEFIGLLNSENIMRARHIRNSQQIRDIYEPLIPTLQSILKRGEASGEFRTGIDPVELYISIGSLCFHFRSNQHTLKAIFDVDLESPKAISRRLDHINEMVLSFCRAKVSQPGDPSKKTASGVG
jgi:AcrR family transcriptional regulator